MIATKTSMNENLTEIREATRFVAKQINQPGHLTAERKDQALRALDELDGQSAWLRERLEWLGT